MSVFVPFRPEHLKLILPFVVVCGLRTHADEPVPLVDAKTALGWFNPLVGEWRGVGQVRRGSTQGAWRETGRFVWDFSKEEPAVRYVVEKGKHLEAARITYEPRTARFVVAATLADDSTRLYRGAIEKTSLVVDSEPDDDGDVHRLVVNRLNEKRTIVRYEKRTSQVEFYTRLAEVGHTRAGTSLAVTGAGEPECIVTGGRGTMLVSHAGKSYYVCCTGCKQAFEDDPEGVVAEYEAKLAERARPD